MSNNYQEKALTEVHSHDGRHCFQTWEASYLWRSHVLSHPSLTKLELLKYRTWYSYIVAILEWLSYYYCFFLSGGGNWRDWCRLGRHIFWWCNRKRNSSCPSWRTKEKLYEGNYLLTLFVWFLWISILLSKVLPCLAAFYVPAFTEFAMKYLFLIRFNRSMRRMI